MTSDVVTHGSFATNQSTARQIKSIADAKRYVRTEVDLLKSFKALEQAGQKIIKKM